MRRRELFAQAGALITVGTAAALGCRPRGEGADAASRTVPPPTTPRAFAGGHAGENRTVAGVALCWCPPGGFRMGSPVGEPGRRADEAQVDVTLTRGFWMAKHEATQRQWSELMGAWPDRPPSQRYGEGPDVPVYWVSFSDAEAFCARLTEEAQAGGELPVGWRFRLPSEAQWEYACRAGTTSATAFGERLTTEQANFAEFPVGGGRAAEATGQAARIGSYAANPWGLHDMHGNVWEWCRDWYHAELPGGADPDLSSVVGVPNGDGSYSRVRRGGAWIEGEAFCRSAARLRYEPDRGSDHIGFRVSLEAMS